MLQLTGICIIFLIVRKNVRIGHTHTHKTYQHDLVCVQSSIKSIS